ncbi:MAG: hypothetical protein Q9186_002262 [Xanthomendoza sp. 1 TL-2023]
MAQSQVSAKKQQELQQQYTSYKNNLQQLADRIGNIEQETEEHKLTAFLFRLVLDTLKPLPGERKCFRMINGVLVERTVKDVMPALQTNSDGLKKVLEELVKQYKRQQEDMEKWKGATIKRTTFKLYSSDPGFTAILAWSIPESLKAPIPLKAPAEAVRAVSIGFSESGPVL